MKVNLNFEELDYETLGRLAKEIRAEMLKRNANIEIHITESNAYTKQENKGSD